MDEAEKNIIKGTKEFAKAHHILFDKKTESLVLNAIREMKKLVLLNKDNSEAILPTNK